MCKEDSDTKWVNGKDASREHSIYFTHCQWLFKFPGKTIPNNYASIPAIMILQCRLNIKVAATDMRYFTKS